MYRMWWNFLSSDGGKSVTKGGRLYHSFRQSFRKSMKNDSIHSVVSFIDSLSESQKRHFTSTLLLKDSSFSIDYYLPEDKIAKTPCKNREDSKLLLCSCKDNNINGSYLPDQMIYSERKDLNQMNSSQENDGVNIDHFSFKYLPKILDSLSKQSLDNNQNSNKIK